MQPGELLTVWTARGAMLVYMAFLWNRTARKPGSAWPVSDRWLWTLTAVLHLVHVFCAFQFVHHWSHSAALHATAEQTAELTGLADGRGLFLNYALTALWPLDAFSRWLPRTGSQPRLKWFQRGTECFVLFMAFNATVIFGRPETQLVTSLLSLVLLLRWRIRRQRHAQQIA